MNNRVLVQFWEGGRKERKEKLIKKKRNGQWNDSIN
jgi:hypothetical protein